MFSLNTQSGMLHLEDHGGGSNAEEFERADEADRFMFEQGKPMKFCKTCFPDNKNAMDDLTTTPDTIPTDTPRSAASGPTENTTRRGTMPDTARDMDDNDGA